MDNQLTRFFKRPELSVNVITRTRPVDEIGMEIRGVGANEYRTTFWYRPITIFNGSYFWQSIAEKLQNLLYHKTVFGDEAFETAEQLLAFIDAHHPRFSPQEKVDALLEYLQQQTAFDGQPIWVDLLKWDDDELFRQFFMGHAQELRFYLGVLKEDGLVAYSETEGSAPKVNITLKGLNKLMAIAEKRASRICFVAMSFSPLLAGVYDSAIAPAIIANGFLPLLLRDEQVDADKTINDAILAGLKKAKFTLADFTGHRVNVYFEAGFALGRGQKLIYSCREDEVEKAGFDTRNFQHLVWENEEDFRKKLSDKIQAYIME